MWKLAYNVKGNAVEKKAQKWRVRGYDHPAERNSVGMTSALLAKLFHLSWIDL